MTLLGSLLAVCGVVVRCFLQAAEKGGGFAFPTLFPVAPCHFLPHHIHFFFSVFQLFLEVILILLNVFFAVFNFLAGLLKVDVCLMDLLEKVLLVFLIEHQRVACFFHRFELLTDVFLLRFQCLFAFVDGSECVVGVGQRQVELLALFLCLGFGCCAFFAKVCQFLFQ